MAGLQVIVPLVVVLVGVILAADFKKAATRHVEMASGLVRPVSGRLRRNETDEAARRRLAFFVRMDRALGALFVLVGIMMLGTALSDLL